MLALYSLVPALLLAGTPPAANPAASAKTQSAAACTKSDSADCHHGTVPQGFVPQEKGGEVVLRGEKLSGAPQVKLEELLAQPGKYTGKTVLVEARVRKACERKGCWMELSQGEKGPGVRITFKDYAFFVPTQSQGYVARVEGEVKVAELSEDRAKHYESEGAIVPRGKDGKPTEVQLVARGVELRR
jgi:hypothetical protein